MALRTNRQTPRLQLTIGKAREVRSEVFHQPLDRYATQQMLTGLDQQGSKASEDYSEDKADG